MEATFRTVLSDLEAAVGANFNDPNALVDGLRQLRKKWPSDPTPEDVRRSFAICNAALILKDLGELGPRVNYSVMEMYRRLMVDPAGWHRRHVRHSFDHHTAFGRAMPGSRYDGPIPTAHLPITAAEARALVQPLLTAFEAGIGDDPMRHTRLAWDVLEHPIAPFDQVFDTWLREADENDLGLGNSHLALRRAMAFHGLAERGQQRVSRKGVDEIFLPVLDDPNPMLAAAAARFLGRVHEDPDLLYNNGIPWRLPDLLDHIAARPPAVRRAVAGGFLNGFADTDEPFALLRKDARLEGYDLDGWTISVLAGSQEEILIPSAQAFWFYVHEAYATAPEFVACLIDEGHDWVAMMCAAELRDVVPGMKSILLRLVESQDKDAAAGASNHLRHFYPDA